MQSFRWYLNRLGRMSAPEIAYRLRHLTRTSLGRLGMAESAHVPGRVTQSEPCTFVHLPGNLDSAGYAVSAQRIVADRHSVFDLEEISLGRPPNWNRDPLTGRIAPLVHASALNYKDAACVGNIKYLWEPNRHLHLPTLAQAHAVTQDIRYADEVRRHLESWLQQCPYPKGANWTSSLELAIRLINWSIAWQLLGGEKSIMFSDAAGRTLLDAWLRSVYLHARTVMRNLSRFSSANNHLIGEAAGVWIASVTWPYWPQLLSWGGRCRQILAREIQAQNAADGGNREQAFAYQQFIIDFFLLAGLAARARKADFEPAYWHRLEQMVEFLASMTDAGGNVPMIGDADDGYAVRLSPEADFCPYRSLIATGALLFERPDLARKAGRIDEKTLWLLGEGARGRFENLLAAAPERFTPRRKFADSGYFLLGDKFETAQEIRLFIDAGPLGFGSLAAHGHADALSVLLNVGGMEVLVDPGTYVYHMAPEWRSYFRGTRAHNTVMVDEADQSVQGGGFMWSRHAEAICLDASIAAEPQRFVGQHDGYRRLADPVVHRREIVFNAGRGEIQILDAIECRGRHKVLRHWHLSERLAPTIQGGVCTVAAGRFKVIIEPGESLEHAHVYRGGTAAEGGWISRSFGRKEPCTTLCWESSVQGNTLLRTRIRCLAEGDR